MAEIKTPISKFKEIVRDTISGKIVKRIFSPNNPHYFEDKDGKLQPINLDTRTDKLTNLGDASIQDKNIVSVGLLKGDTVDKFIGIRPTETAESGEEQLEFSIKEIQYDGVPTKFDFTRCEKVDAITTRLGDPADFHMLVQNNRQSNRQLFSTKGGVCDYRISYDLNLIGLKIENQELDRDESIRTESKLNYESLGELDDLDTWFNHVPADPDSYSIVTAKFNEQAIIRKVTSVEWTEGQEQGSPNYDLKLENARLNDENSIRLRGHPYDIDENNVPEGVRIFDGSVSPNIVSLLTKGAFNFRLRNFPEFKKANVKFIVDKIFYEFLRPTIFKHTGKSVDVQYYADSLLSSDLARNPYAPNYDVQISIQYLNQPLGSIRITHKDGEHYVIGSLMIEPYDMDLWNKVSFIPYPIANANIPYETLDAELKAFLESQYTVPKLEVKGEYFLPDKNGDFTILRKDGSFFCRIRKPRVYYEDLTPVDIGETFHTLKRNLDGSFEYIKYASYEGITSEKIKKAFWIDAETVYTQDTNAEGYVGRTELDLVYSVAHDHTDGNFVFSNTGNYSYAMTVQWVPEGKVGYWILVRSFLRFDCSGETNAKNVSLFVYGDTYGESGVTVQQGTQGETLGTADYDAFSGSSFAEVDPWNASAYNEFTFDATGITAFNTVAGSSYLELCLRENDYDYDNVVAWTPFRNGMYYSDYTGTSRDPYLEYEKVGGQRIFGVV